MAVDMHQLYSQMFFELPAVPHESSYFRNADVQLDNQALWQAFHDETTEMIITKLGRRMFPAIQLQINGLDRNSQYSVYVEITPSSDRRQKYNGNGDDQEMMNKKVKKGWTNAGVAEAQPPIGRRMYIHPDSPATGQHWMQQPVTFTKLKLTNNLGDHHRNVLLTSMHKYIPRIWIVYHTIPNLSVHAAIATQPKMSFFFRETEFIAVTAYQNDSITKLKINNNPFAKGFRENGQSRSKRKREDSQGDEEEDQHLDGEFNFERTKRLNDSPQSDDSGVCSSDAMTPPPPPPPPPPPSSNHQASHDHSNDHPKLYRPWADSTDVPATNSVNNRLELPSSVMGSLQSTIAVAPSNYRNNLPGNFPCHQITLPTQQQSFEAAMYMAYVAQCRFYQTEALLASGKLYR